MQMGKEKSSSCLIASLQGFFLIACFVCNHKQKHKKLVHYHHGGVINVIEYLI